MLPLGQWLELSWARYKEKLWEQLVIGGLGGAAGLLAGVLPLLALAPFWLRGGGPSWTAWGLALGVSASAVLWLVSWTQAAMMESALTVGRLSWSRAYALAWPKTAAFSWVCILWFVALAGAFFLFIVPAAALGVLLAFAPFACIADSATGFSALERSISCVRGRWWPVFGRLLIVGAVLAAAGAAPVVGFILSALAAPFSLVAMAVLYEDLRRAPTEDAGARGAARGWAWACAAGLAIMLAFAAATARTLAATDLGTLAAAVQSLAQSQLSSAGVDPAILQQ